MAVSSVNSTGFLNNYISKRQRMELQIGQMKLERTSFEPVWKDIGRLTKPKRMRFEVTRGNRGQREDQAILDGTATMAGDTLRAGMMGGITSPSRSWFKLTTPDPDLAEFGRVKEWLYKVQMEMNSIYSRSNVYKSLPNVYGDAGNFGTSPMMVQEDFRGNVIHTDTFAIGSYWIAKDAYGQVNTFAYEGRMTVRQLIERFGTKKDGMADWSNFSTSVRSMWEAGQSESWVNITFFVGPNIDFDYFSPWSKNKKFAACWFESGTNANGQQLAQNDSSIFLEEKGYDYFPVLGLRWETSGEDVYATGCPGMTALGDIQQLMFGESRSLEAIDQHVKPTMIAPTSLKTKFKNLLPGDIIFTDMREGQAGARRAFEIDFDISTLEGKQQQIRQRIDRAYYADLFLMLSNAEQRDRTAYEISERKEEKLLALGPVLEQTNGDVLDPLTSITFGLGLKQRRFPPPPPELEGIDLKIEYISVAAQAQKLIGVSTMDRFIQSIGMISQFDQRAVRKFKGDQAVDVYADILSVNPSIIRTDEEVEAMDAADARQAQMAQRAEQINLASQSAKNLAQSPTTGDNALTEVMALAQAGQ